MADRFPELSENDSTSLVDRKNSENTKKGTKATRAYGFPETKTKNKLGDRMIKQLLTSVNIVICQCLADQLFASAFGFGT